MFHAYIYTILCCSDKKFLSVLEVDNENNEDRTYFLDYFLNVKRKNVRLEFKIL